MLRSVVSIDKPLMKKNGDGVGNQTLREYLKNQYVSEEGKASESLFKQVEATTFNRVFLTYKNNKTTAVKILFDRSTRK